MQELSQAVQASAIPTTYILIFTAGFIFGVWLTYTIVKGVYENKKVL